MNEIKKERDSWYGCIPVQADPERKWEGFTADDLNGNEIRCGERVLAKIPKLPGLICRKKRKDGYGHETKYIELVTERWYDQDKQQMRNKRVCIGIDISHIYDGMMIINEKYRQYFNKDGELIQASIKDSDFRRENKETEMKQKEKEETTMENNDQKIQAELDRKEHMKDRFDFLNDLLVKYDNLVDIQAEKRPDMPMSGNQIRRINGLLKDIREFLAPFEYGEYLQMADEGEDEDGKRMTYGDMAVLLKTYGCVMSSYKFGRIWYKVC